MIMTHLSMKAWHIILLNLITLNYLVVCKHSNNFILTYKYKKLGILRNS